MKASLSWMFWTTTAKTLFLKLHLISFVPRSADQIIFSALFVNNFICRGSYTDTPPSKCPGEFHNKTIWWTSISTNGLKCLFNCIRCERFRMQLFIQFISNYISQMNERKKSKISNFEQFECHEIQFRNVKIEVLAWFTIESFFERNKFNAKNFPCQSWSF